MPGTKEQEKRRDIKETWKILQSEELKKYGWRFVSPLWNIPGIKNGAWRFIADPMHTFKNVAIHWIQSMLGQNHTDDHRPEDFPILSNVQIKRIDKMYVIRFSNAFKCSNKKNK